MDERNCELAESLVTPAYIRLGQNSLNRRDKMMRELLSQRQLPQEGIDELTLQYFCHSLALMDSNNFQQKVGVGEREARVFSRLVQERHYYMAHGMGRSGQVAANQPKAAGSSLLLQLTRCLTVSALHQLHYQFVEDVLLLPLATGMSLSLALLTLAGTNPTKKYVVWSRIDQKTCLKSILTANLCPAVVELRQVGDSLCSDVEAIEAKVRELGVENVLCVMSTTSCFAPRVPDDVEALSLLAKKYGIGHVVNNAYGLWCSKIAHALTQAHKKGQCTVVVQSTDKNFMVPVGGSIIFTQRPALLASISTKYPGRACSSPILDLFITLLSMGKCTIRRLATQRKLYFEAMKATATSFAHDHHLHVLQTPSNTISIALSIKELQLKNATKLGSILYSKRVIGHRIVERSDKITNIEDHSFANYGSHCNNYCQLPYITFACAVGTKQSDCRIFFKRLQTSILQLQKEEHKIKQSKEVSTVTTILPQQKQLHTKQQQGGEMRVKEQYGIE